ncbi:MAG: hypothetical protein KDE14_11480 [Rhodobacteraceae bacterium]|nr:hypothetical protein [Paracoccaceae bacterium]
MTRSAILLLICSLIVSVVIVEAMMRMAGFVPREVRVNRFFVAGSSTTWSEPDTELGWINRAGISTSLEGEGVPMTYWSHSRRAVRAAEEPPSRDFPVMIIGGSNAQSYGVRDEESFAFKLGEKLPGVWLENFGTGGYSTVQAMMLMDRELKAFYGAVPPKLILLGFDDSHILRNVSDQSWVYSISDPEGRYVAPPHYRLNGDVLTFYPFTTIGFWPLERESAAATVLHNVWLQSFAYNTAVQGPEVTRRTLRQLADHAAAAGSDFAAVILEDRSRQGAAVMDGMPFPVLDCSGPERTDPAAYLLDGGSHPNAKLHTHYADCIAPWLADYVASKSVPAQP